MIVLCLIYHSPSEFRNALLFKDSVLVDRIFQVFDRDDDGEICFQEYVACLSILSLKASSEEKLTCNTLRSFMINFHTLDFYMFMFVKAYCKIFLVVSFQIYDFDNDGMLSASDLTAVVAATLRY